MNTIFKDSLRAALVRAIRHEIEDNFRRGHITYEMRLHLLSETNKFQNAWEYTFPHDLSYDLRMANGTQRILPLIVVYDEYLKKEN